MSIVSDESRRENSLTRMTSSDHQISVWHFIQAKEKQTERKATNAWTMNLWNEYFIHSIGIRWNIFYLALERRRLRSGRPTTPVGIVKSWSNWILTRRTSSRWKDDELKFEARRTRRSSSWLVGSFRWAMPCAFISSIELPSLVAVLIKGRSGARKWSRRNRWFKSVLFELFAVLIWYGVIDKPMSTESNDDPFADVFDVGAFGGFRLRFCAELE